MELANLNLLEEKIRGLLALISKLREENKEIHTELNEGVSLENMLDQKRRQQLRTKIEEMLELLKDF